VLNGEPWIYPNAVVDGPQTRGVVHVLSEDAKHIGWADYNPKATIRARILMRSERWPGEQSYVAQRIQQALWRRIGLGLQPQGNALRLINGEGDGMPGLVVDIYGGTMVIDLYTAGMCDRRDTICHLLGQFLSDLTPVVRMGPDAAKREACEPIVADLIAISFAENGVIYRFDLDQTQKSGWYLDQRDNRRFIAHCARDRRVLDLFSYHGAFSLSAMAAGAQSALAVDSSQAAIDALENNASHNGFPVTAVKADVFDWLDQALVGDDRYDLIICDPPKLAPRRNDKQKALKAYRFLVDRTLRLLAPNGLLLVSSCSQIIDGEDLRKVVMQQAVKRGQELDIVAQTTQPADHPWPVAFRIGHYLSSVIIHLRPQAQID
jgi:23S rRNA (cytosine1962-C5)-methyltransferase